MGRQPAQNFHGFAKGDHDAIAVTVQAQIYLLDPESMSELPPLTVRIVPGQHDDLLVSAPDLDLLGWNRTPEHFVLSSCGISLARETPGCRINLSRELDERGVSILRTMFTVDLEPHESRIVTVERVGTTDGLNQKWLSPASTLKDAGIEIPEGPVLPCSETQKILFRNRNDHRVEISSGRAVALERDLNVDEQTLSTGLDMVEVGSSFQKMSNPGVSSNSQRQNSNPPDGPYQMVGRRHSLAVPIPRLHVVLRWLLMFLLVLQRASTNLLVRDPMEPVQVNLQGLEEADCASPSWIYDDFESPEYKAAVGAALDELRHERYKHLSDSRWNKLRKLLVSNSYVLYIEGSKPTTIDPQFQFDVQFKPGAKPVRATLPRYSPPQAERERHHVLKEQSLGHLRIPEKHQLSEWVTRTHVVHKKDDELGRWICDFRALNNALEKRGITIGDCHDKVRRLCGCLWKTGVDCWSGFNQMNASEAARRAMTICTSLGLRQWTVMPFGVCNGPAVFHGAMLEIFQDIMFGTGADGDLIKSLDALVEFFMDDGAIGSGNCDRESLELDARSDVLFDKHLRALACVFKRCRSVNLRLKLSKCYFCQFELGLLGMIVGRGNMSCDPQKTIALSAWPRPSRREDVEKFLCSFGYIRQFLSPEFSEIAKPLRDCLSDLHAARSTGKYRKGAKKQPPAPPLPNDTWPEFWSQEAEDSFVELKRLAVEAVSLAFPDFEGAASGFNPMHLFVDASKYGVGGGLFQCEKADLNGEPDLYAVLGVPRWATKRDILLAYNGFKKACKGFEDKRTVSAEVQSAFEILYDAETKKAYDSERGIKARKLAAKPLRPLAFHSKSLNVTQRGWNTWERELLGIIEFFNSNSALITGMHVIIHTDHLNSTLLNAVLQYPDKILRMLLKIEAKCIVTWQFLAGCQNHVGDGLSRNPPDRDSARGKAETNEGLPKTLGEAFKQVLGAREVHGEELEFLDPTSEGTAPERGGEKSSNSEGKGNCTELTQGTCKFSEVHSLAREMSPIKLCPVKTAVTKHGLGCKHVHVVLLPSYTEQEELLDDIVFTGGNDDVFLDSVHTLTPQYACPMGTRRWLEPYTKPPWNKQVVKALRNSVFDGVLATLRTVRDGMLGGVVGYGEGGLIVLSMCSLSLRRAAYAARAVSFKEQADLEAGWEIVSHVVIVAPHCLPLAQYIAFWRECVPETLCIPSLQDKQVVVFIPIHDAAKDPAIEVSAWIQDCIVVEYKFTGPAYRMVPQFLPVDCLKHTPKTDVITKDDSPVIPTFYELWSGSCVLGAQMLAYGFLCRAFERDPKGSTFEDPRDRGDLDLPENQNLVRQAIESGLAWLLHFSPPCGSFSLVQNLSGTTRTAERPEGDGSRECEVIGNKCVAQMLWYIFLCLKHQVLFSFEHPKGSRALLLPLLKFIESLAGVRRIEYDGCAYGLRPPGWTAAQSDARIQNPSVIITNCPHFEALHKKCGSVGPHKHESAIAWHDREGGSYLKHTGEYPPQLCVSYARCSVTAWRQKFVPPKHVLPNVTLAKLESNVGVTPEELFGAFDLVDGNFTGKTPTSSSSASGDSPLRVRAAGESSSSSAKFPEPQSSGGSEGTVPEGVTAAEGSRSKERNATEDFWVETDTTWIWRHIKPRTVFCSPYDSNAPPNGPEPDTLGKRRETFLVAIGVDKSYYINDRDYTCKTDVRHRKVTTPFRGSTVFHKKSAGASEPAAEIPSEPPIMVPNSVESLSLQLSAMRRELSLAQVQDPALKAIISCLQHKKAGEYLADPLREGTKTRARARHFRLSKDKEGLILLVCYDPELKVDLPVVPETIYDGASKHKDAPKRMTWKHLLLGAVHNTATGVHKNSKEMASELKSVCAWQRPWELRGDCDKWVARCKLCVSVHSRPASAPPLGHVRAYKPFFRLQWDMMEVKPMGEDGENYILTAICPATKYPFLRTLTTRDSEVVAEQMLDVILDIGVVPCIHQSDNEFANLAVSELISLLGAVQLFSAALRPQSQGLVERIHRDIRAGLAIAVESLCRAKPRRWPRYLRRLEYKLRHKTLANGRSPFEAVHGFAGSSGLHSALGAFDEIPEELVFASWLQEIVSESSKICAELEVITEEQAEQRERKQAESVRPVEFLPGELVLLKKPFYEKGEGVILPQADGPYKISTVLDPYNVYLEDPLTGETACRGARISTARLIKYDFPQEWAELDLEEDVVRTHDITVGTYVCVPVLLKGRSDNRVLVTRVERFFPAQEQFEATLFEVPRGSRLGPWTRRTWAVKTDENTGAVLKQVFHNNEVLAVVELDRDKALTRRSLELLEAAGVDVSNPTLDSTLPGAYSRGR